jgi:diacylglycerol kinase (ATP)
MDFLVKCDNAFEAFKKAYQKEKHLRFHCIAASIASVMAFFQNFSLHEWFILIICFAVVISAELFNTAIERLCDFVHSSHSDEIKFIKDIASMAVLVCTIAAAIIGFFLFFPYYNFL